MVKYGKAVMQLKDIISEVPECILGLVLYLQYIADPSSSASATYANDIVILVVRNNPVVSTSTKESTSRSKMANQRIKPIYMTYSTRKKMYPPITINDLRIPQAEISNI
jgi:hypothetical protein